jgi:predicted DNA-binding transcriptional regulator AlpA
MSSLLTRQEVCAAIKLSTAQLYVLMDRGVMPRPIKFGAGRNSMVRWRAEEIEAAISSMPRSK